MALGRGRSRLAAALLLGAWVVFLGSQVAEAMRVAEGGRTTDVSKDIVFALWYAAIALLVAGIIVADRFGARSRIEVRSYTRALWAMAGLSLVGAALGHEILMAPNQGAAWIGGAWPVVEFLRDVMAVAALALAFTSWSRTQHWRGAHAVTGASAVALFLFPPVGPLVGVGWLFKVRKAETPESPLADLATTPA